MQHIIDKEEALVEQNTSYREHRMISDQYKILATKFYNKISHRLSKFDGNFLEIGTFNGMGTSNLAKEFPEKQFYVIDPFIEDGNTGYIVNSSLTSQRRNALANFEELENIVLFEMRSDTFKDKWIDKVEDIDVIFIDGSHIYEDVKNDLEIVDQVLKISGYVFVDDYQIEGVKKACLEFLDSHDNYDRVEEGVFRRIK